MRGLRQAARSQFCLFTHFFKHNVSPFKAGHTEWAKQKERDCFAEVARKDVRIKKGGFEKGLLLRWFWFLN
jgi:hypothetical protein